MSNRKKTDKAGRKPLSIIAVLICIALFSYFIISFVSKRLEINRKQAELDAVSAECSLQNKENEELSAAIEGGDAMAQAEQYARQDGYAYPDEHVFIDATPGSSN